VLYNTRRSSGSDMGSVSICEAAMSPLTAVVSWTCAGKRLVMRLGMTWSEQCRSKAPRQEAPPPPPIQLHDLTCLDHEHYTNNSHSQSTHTMAAPAVEQPIVNGTNPSNAKPLELAFTLPSNPHTQLHVQLTIHATTILVFVTTTTPENTSQATPLGSFVYALPDRYNPSQPLSTPIYSITHTLDFTQRLAKLLARKTGRACYVGNSASFRDSVQGGTVEEEMEAFGAVVKVVMGEIGKSEG
jgi:hypothetical protein